MLSLFLLRGMSLFLFSLMACGNSTYPARYYTRRRERRGRSLIDGWPRSLMQPGPESFRIDWKRGQGSISLPDWSKLHGWSRSRMIVRWDGNRRWTWMNDRPFSIFDVPPNAIRGGFFKHANK